METMVITVLVTVLVLVVADLASLRYGADSRHSSDPRHDWW